MKIYILPFENIKQHSILDTFLICSMPRQENENYPHLKGKTFHKD